MRPSSPIASSVRDGLLAEHLWIRGFLDDAIGAVSDGDDARAKIAWDAFAASLLSHLDGEDRLIARLPPEHARTARLLAHEHRYLRLQVAELGRAVEDRTLRSDRLSDLRDILQAHAHNDERLLYRWAEENLDEGERQELIVALARRRRHSESMTAKSSSTFTGFVR